MLRRPAESLAGPATALILTITLVLAAAGIGVDLIGWQCTAPGKACGSGRSWLRWLTQPPWDEPGRRLLVGALLPVLVIVLLWLMGRRTWKSYEAVEPPRTSPISAPQDSDYGELPMADPKFWWGGDLLDRRIFGQAGLWDQPTATHRSPQDGSEPRSGRSSAPSHRKICCQDRQGSLGATVPPASTAIHGRVFAPAGRERTFHAV